jgi:hypothetical protein
LQQAGGVAVAAGELEGVGRWRFFRDDGGSTTLFYQWDVGTTRPWMNALAPLARPALAWNHDRVMAAGGEGLPGASGHASCRPAEREGTPQGG